MMEEVYGIPTQPVEYYDKEIRDVYYCKECKDIIPLSRKNIGICEECDTTPLVKKMSPLQARRKFLQN